MKHSTGKPTKAQAARMDRIARFPCIACRRGRDPTVAGAFPICGKTEVHHLNMFGRAGQKRRGHDATIPLGEWHHRGIPLPGWTTKQMEVMFGPSLAKASKRFRAEFGTDDELLAKVNGLLGIAA